MQSNSRRDTRESDGYAEESNGKIQGKSAEIQGNSTETQENSTEIQGNPKDAGESRVMQGDGNERHKNVKRHGISGICRDEEFNFGSR